MKSKFRGEEVLHSNFVNYSFTDIGEPDPKGKTNCESHAQGRMHEFFTR